ncbi:MAG TPA: glutathione S-transferase family protein [Kofleriaceae bacterium]|nr:glutathione S-transferase family protein [Kofleriaceae bacterium]
MRVWRIPYSTNVERVAIAAGVGGIPVEWVDVDAYDRTPVKDVSGQGRVPVADLDGEIVVGSLAIIDRIAPGLWPAEQRPRAHVDVFLDWFERVWMHPLGVLFTPGVDEERRERAGARLERSLDRFEAMLDGTAFLFNELTIADIAAYPFLKYATDDANPDDDYEIHHLMRRYQSLDGRPRVAAWLERVSALPRA